MPASESSPFARPEPGVRIRQGVPELRRPNPEEIASFPEAAGQLVQSTWTEQQALVNTGPHRLEWLQGRHILLVGATGGGLGGALAVAVLHLLGDRGSLTVVARDLKKSVGYQSGLAMQSWAENAGWGKRFHWLNSGVAPDGKRLGEVVSALREAGADRVVYVNTVAAASSGMLPRCPPVFVKDVDEAGLFQWELPPLDERSIEATKFVMGTLAVEFPRALEESGIGVEAVAFTDWRGSLDHSSRDPDSPDYGRQGAYSTSLYLPKDIIQQATSSAYGSGKVVLDLFLPMMKTQALGMIPGGRAMYDLYETILKKDDVKRALPPELALDVLDRIGRAVEDGDDNPFPRLDQFEAPLDLYFLEVLSRLNQDENSDFYYRRWLSS